MSTTRKVEKMIALLVESLRIMRIEKEMVHRSTGVLGFRVNT